MYYLLPHEKFNPLGTKEKWETLYFWGGGGGGINKEHRIVRGSQAIPARPSDEDRIRVKTLG
jgi:hypothetical protein